MKSAQTIPFNTLQLLKEVSYRVSRSGGKGGQNVNKVSTRVELCFDVNQSKALNEAQKILVMHKLASRINSAGILLMTCQEARTQYMNRKTVNEKFITLLQKCFIPKKKRVPVTLPESVKEERLKEKKITSEKKIQRKTSWTD